MLRSFCHHLAILLTILLIWQISFNLNIFSILLLPSPKMIFISLGEMIINNNLYPDLLSTVYRMFFGLSIGIILGVILGMLVVSSKKIYSLLEFWIDFLRSIPPPALIPIFLLFFGIGNTSKIMLIIFVTTLLTMINTIYGIKNVNSNRIMIAKTMKLSKLETFLKIILPDSLPHISSGIRIAISLSLVVVIVSEMIMGSNLGLGKKIIDYQLMFQTSNMYTVIIITGIIGYTFNKMYLVFEKRYIHWMGM